MTSPATASSPSRGDGIADIDHHFARFIARFGGGPEVAGAAMFLSHAVSKGHICLDLKERPEEASEPWLTPDEWRRELAASRAVTSPEDERRTPLVLDAAGRLYLRRYYDYEQALAAHVRHRATDGAGDSEAVTGDDQDTAVATALARKLTVITGGPGTGKTTTVVRILSKLLEMAPGTRIALAAPTGKAAARLEQAVRENWTRFAGSAPAECAARIPRASTLHRLLGSRPNSPDFKHHAGHPLAVDLVVVDEASMVPLPLMARFFDAVPESARVILLGDRDQLASVDPGSVLADIADAAAEPGSPLRPALATLRTNHRFGSDSTIYRLCETVRVGDAAAALAIASAPERPDFAAKSLPSPSALSQHLKEAAVSGFGPFLAERDPAAALTAFGRFRILAALRKGPYGVEDLNRRVEAILRAEGLLHGHGPRQAGMPILIQRNDYQLGLFNGDIGILLPAPGADDSLWAWFPGSTPETPLMKIPPARLPEHEPAFAMTVHKSQGSEFENVLFLLPDRDTPVLSRELIYTGLTRARNRVEVWTASDVFVTGVTRKTRRASGLRDALR